MPSHFYLPIEGTDLTVGDSLALSREQIHYLSRVLRRRDGDILPCFDGAGLCFQGALTFAQKTAGLRITHINPRIKPPPPANHLALALLKGAAMDRAIQLACESGADELSLFIGDRSNAKLDQSRMANKVEHWRKIIVAACEQSGRSFLPRFNPDKRLQDLLTVQTNTYVLHMDGGPFNFQMGADRLLLIGPEGGWSESELARFDEARAQRVSVGPNTLRAESTPGAALAILSYLDRSG